MATADEIDPGVAFVFFAGLVMVAFSTPLNIIMLLQAWGLLAALGGSYMADNSDWLVFGVAVLLNLGSYLVPATLALLLLRRRSAQTRRLAVLALAGLNLCVCLADVVLNPLM